MTPIKNYVCKLTAEQADQLKELLLDQQWELDTIPYAYWRARREKTTTVAYESGKLVIQGKGTEDLVKFTLEPQVLKEVRLGYEDIIEEAENPAMFEPHAGIDESGKGDYFGPMVIAAAYVDGDTARELLDLGVKDSKVIKSEKKIHFLAERIRAVVKGRFALVTIGPVAYNRLYETMGNVNKILGWGHARALENLLEKTDFQRAVSDQFGRKQTVIQALMKKGRKIELEQRPKAESDIAVAAASILARSEFVRRLRRLGETVDTELPKGASAAVIDTAVAIAESAGMERLGDLAKLHFRTTEKVRAAAGL